MSIQVEVVNTSWGGSLNDRIADLGRRVSSLEATRTVINDGTITTGAIAAGSITSTEIAAGTITASDIAANTITAGQIAASTITATQIAANTITAGQIAANTITAGQIAAGTITSTQIAAGSILAGNIAAGAITSGLIAANAINAGHIAADSINTGHIQAGTILASDIAAGVITATQIAAGTILAGNIAAHTITATQIAAGTITAGEIQAGTITGTLIAGGTITASNIASATITGGLIAGGTITASNIAAGTITGTLLAAGTITGSLIASATITASNLSVSQLSAISANLGAITAGTLTGATVQTAATGSRVVLNTGGITAYNAADTPVLAFDTATGNLTLTGTVNANSSSVIPVQAFQGAIGGGNLVSDGGFENPALAAWTSFSNATLTATSAGGTVRSGLSAGSIAATAGPTLKYSDLVLTHSPSLYLRLNETSGTTALNAAASGTYLAAVTADAPQVYWRLNEPSGTNIYCYPNTGDNFATIVAGLPATSHWLRLDEASGTSFADASGNGRTGTANGGTVGAASVVQGDTGKGFNSTTSTTGITTSYNPFTPGTKRTFCGFVKAPTFGVGNARLITSGGGTTGMYLRSESNASIRLSKQSQAWSGTWAISPVLPGGVGIHWALVVDETVAGANGGGTAELFINGVSMGVLNPSLQWGANEGSIGWAGGNTSEGLPGVFDEVMVFETALTAAQVRQLAGFAPALGGTYSGITLNQTGLIAGDSDKSVTMPNAGSMNPGYYVAFPAGTETKTFEGVFQRATNTDGDTLFGQTGGSGGYSLAIASGTSGDVILTGYTGVTRTWSAAWPGTGVPVHVAFIQNSSTNVSELFINGISQGTKTGLGPGGSTNTVMVGDAGISPGKFNGQIDEVAIYNGALSPARIAAHAALVLRGVYGSGVTLNQTGATGDGDKAASFNNTTNANVATQMAPFSNAITGVTIEGIFKRTATTDTDALFQTGGSNKVYLRLEAGTNDVRFDANSAAGTSVTWTNAWPGTGSFAHWALTFNRTTNTVELFVNGTSKGAIGSIEAYGADVGPIAIGDNTGVAGLLNGVMDEFAIYPTILSSAQIAAHAAAIPNAATTQASSSIITTSAAQAIVAQPTMNYTAAAWFKAATVSRNVRTHIRWYDSGNAFISQSSSTATTTDSTTAYTRSILTAAAPSNAAFARVVAEVVGVGGAGEVHYVDDVTLQAGDIASDGPAIPTNTIIGGMIVADQITAREIAASTITATEIAAATITAGNIAAGTITSAQIAAGTITATQLSSTAIDAMTITGATIQTNTNVNRNKVILDSTGLRAYSTPLAAPNMNHSWIQAWKGLGWVDSPFYPLNDVNAVDPTAWDYSYTGGHHGVYTGGYTQNQTGFTGDGSTATLFNGTTGEITAGGGASSIVASSSFTIHVAFKTTTSSGGGLVMFADVKTGAPTNYTRQVWMDNAGKIWFGIWTGSAVVSLTSPLSYNDGSYHRVYAILKSSNNMELWIDGTLVASNSNTTPIAAQTGYWRAARYAPTSWPSTTTSAFFGGTLAMVGVLTWAIGSAEIAMLEAAIPNTEQSYGFLQKFTNAIFFLTANTTYYYAVTAINSQGETPIGTVVAIRTGSGNPGENVFGFKPLPGAASYRIYRSTTPGTFSQYFTYAPTYLTTPGTPDDPQQVNDDGSWTMLSATPPAGIGTAFTKVLDVPTSGAGTITGPTIRTSDIYPRVQIDSSGLIGYDETGDTVFTLAGNGLGMTLRAGTGDKNTIGWALGNGTYMAAIWGSGTDNATSTLNVTTRNISIKSTTGGSPAPGQKRPSIGSTSTILVADGTTLTVGTGSSAAGNARKLLDTSFDSDWAVAVVKRQIASTSTAGSWQFLYGAPAGVYLAWIYLHGPNRVAITTAIISKPGETNLTPGIFYLNDSAYVGGGNTSITDTNGNANSGLVLVSVGQDGIILNYDPQGAACQVDMRIMRLSPLAAAGTLG